MSRPAENEIGGDFEMSGPEGSWDNYYYLCVCPDCGAVGLKFSGARLELNAVAHIPPERITQRRIRPCLTPTRLDGLHGLNMVTAKFGAIRSHLAVAVVRSNCAGGMGLLAFGRACSYAQLICTHSFHCPWTSTRQHESCCSG